MRGPARGSSRFGTLCIYLRVDSSHLKARCVADTLRVALVRWPRAGASASSLPRSSRLLRKMLYFADQAIRV